MKDTDILYTKTGRYMYNKNKEGSHVHKTRVSERGRGREGGAGEKEREGGVREKWREREGGGQERV